MTFGVVSGSVRFVVIMIVVEFLVVFLVVGGLWTYLGARIFSKAGENFS